MQSNQTRRQVIREAFEVMTPSERNYVQRERDLNENESPLDILAVESHTRSERDSFLPYHSLRTPAIDRFIRQEQRIQSPRTLRAA